MLWLLSACERPPEPTSPPSIVLVTLDTTRADRIGAYGYKAGHTPNIDKLAAQGVRFEEAYTTVPLTSAAHASLLSGLYPAHTGVHGNGDSTLPEEVATLAERLQTGGYSTMASVGAFVTTHLWNFDQGFDFYFDQMNPFEPNRWGVQRPASAVMLDVEQNLSKLASGKPLFLWIHIYDPHLPWGAPGIWQQKGADGYDSEIAFSDAQIGRVRSWIEKAVGERIIWVIIGDHGEGLAGDFERGHGMYLRPETTRVPFVIRPSEPLKEPIVIDEVVSIVDVAPTLLSLAGLPLAGVDGVDLSPVLAGEAISRPPVVIESEMPRMRLGWAPEVAVVDEGLKLYDSPGGPTLYALSDHAEQTDLAAARPADVERLRTVASEIRSIQPLGRGVDLGGIEAQLEALGYADAASDTVGAHIDAKTRVDVVRRLDEARDAREGRRSDVDPVQVWRELLDADPDLIEARLSLVLAAERRGDRALALSLLDEGIARTPNVTSLRLDRGRLMLSLGRNEDAKADAEAILQRDPESRTARDLLLSSIPPALALERVREWQAASPNDAFLHARAGQALLQLARIGEASDELRLALQADPPWVGVHTALAMIAAQRGRAAESMQHLGSEVALFPESVPGWIALGEASLARSDVKTALEAFQRAFALSPADRDARRGLAETLLRSGDLHNAEELLAPLLPSEDPRVLVVYGNLLKAKGDPKGDALLSKLLDQR